MGFKKPHITVILGVVALFIALVFQIIAVAADGWINTDTGEVFGLWRSCCVRRGICIDIRISFEPEMDAIKATRAFAILGVIFIALALVAGILIMFIHKKVMTRIAGAVAIAAAVFVVISFAIFIGKIFPPETLKYYDLSYCFALTVVAFILCIASGISFILSNIF